MQALAARFSDAAVTVDQTVFNAARIWKVYGSLVVKGDHTPERPHRYAVLDDVPAPLVPLSREALATLAALAPPAHRTVSAPASRAPLAPLDLVAAFQARGWYKRPLDRGKHAVVCPWASEHSGDSGVTESVLFEPKAPGDPWGYQCQHAHCVHRTIRDVLGALGLTPAAGERVEAAAAPPEDDTWPPPQSIPTALPPVPPFEIERLLPWALAPWVHDVAERAQCPQDLVADGGRGRGRRDHRAATRHPPEAAR